MFKFKFNFNYKALSKSVNNKAKIIFGDFRLGGFYILTAAI